jgi:hypothetical protein
MSLRAASTKARAKQLYRAHKRPLHNRMRRRLLAVAKVLGHAKVASTSRRASRERHFAGCRGGRGGEAGCKLNPFPASRA